ncbi:hypothetical protein [Leuconostoc lactis]|uniref:hypothetical protein n=1 Tax=Leuconostoc lactis TaxID=1246 RepID=UPI00049704B9|nr:hypothetical protein [Leuconostoc lactis]
MYLSKEEYVALNLGTAPDNYDQLERRAEIELNRVTRSFYMTTDLTTDVKWRREPFKLAMAFQINHMYTSRLTTAQAVADKPVSVSQSVGGTTINKSFAKPTTDEASVLSLDAKQALYGTGLLYSGVSYA